MQAADSSALLTADGRGRVLADGTAMPLLGLGVWQVPDGPACVRSVRVALELGYRHIDTAQAYGNEASVGGALRESGLARDEVFLTTKFQPGPTRPPQRIRPQHRAARRRPVSRPLARTGRELGVA